METFKFGTGNPSTAGVGFPPPGASNKHHEQINSEGLVDDLGVGRTG